MELDLEALRKSAEKRRNSSTQETIQDKWRCEYCTKEFVHEKSFMKHFCPAREKIEVLKSNTGQAAYQLYSTWLRLMKRSPQSIDKFGGSNYFNNFINFVEWSQKLTLPNPETFIKLMIEYKLPPAMWARSTSYEAYLSWLDEAVPPETQFINSLNYIKTLFDNPHSTNVYDDIGVSKLLKAIKNRKLSAWFLLTSKKFKSWVIPKVEKEEFVQAMDTLTFSKKLNQNIHLVREFEAAHEEEGT